MSIHWKSANNFFFKLHKIHCYSIPYESSGLIQVCWRDTIARRKWEDIKNILICVPKIREESYGFEMTWGWIKDRILIYGWALWLLQFLLTPRTVIITQEIMSWHNYYCAWAIVLISSSTWLWSNSGCFIGLITGYWIWPRSLQSDPYYDIWVILMTSHHCAMLGWSHCVFLQQVILVLFHAENSSSSAEVFAL